ncbi:TPA: AAA family ATPase [Pseudomonas aeruginosa]|nr:AAA family ATPase [Pseudomonas aeruginosa]HDQ4722864.1 AAA family ATPase [Pseudomonas aeruginosa]
MTAHKSAPNFFAPSIRDEQAQRELDAARGVITRIDLETDEDVRLAAAGLKNFGPPKFDNPEIEARAKDIFVEATKAAGFSFGKSDRIWRNAKADENAIETLVKYQVESIGASRPKKGTELLADAQADTPIEFISDNYPVGEVTLLSGDNGVGKSMYTTQIGIAEASGYSALGHSAGRNPVLFVSAEDFEAQFRWRYQQICIANHLGFVNDFTKEALDRFAFWEIVGKALWVADQRSQAGKPTRTLVELERVIKESGARLVFIDNATTVYYANHNAPEQVNAFIGYLRNLARRTNCAVVLLAHIPAATAIGQSTKDYYGSMAWASATRSRLVMRLVVEADGVPEHVLVSQVKSSYGKKQGDIYKLIRSDTNGTLSLLTNRQIAESLNENVSNIAEEVLADMLTMRERDDFVNVASTGSSNFYSCFVSAFPDRYTDRNRKRKDEVRLAIARLAEEGRVIKQSRTTKSRNVTTVWIPVAADEGGAR